MRKLHVYIPRMIMFSLTALLVAQAPQALAVGRTWAVPSTSTGDWFIAANWNPSDNYPQAGDAAIITNGYVLLTNATAALASFSITNATLIFSNWNTALNSTTVTVQNAGTLTLPSPFTTDQMSNKIYVVCTNFTLNAGGQLLADARGYARTNGPGRGTNNNTRYQGSGGGGYGGKGGGGVMTSGGGYPYGSTNAPLAPGSGGGAKSDGNWSISNPSHGGGGVRVEAAGAVTIDGTITANGGNGAVDSIYNDTPSGGGSGGAIYITCVSFGGSTNGILQANGGNGGIAPSYTYHAGGGGGGRIAVMYQSLSGTPGVRFSANRGLAITTNTNIVQNINLDINAPLHRSASQVGTLCFTNSALLDSVLNAWSGAGSGLNGYFVFQSTNVWAPTNLLMLSNSTLGILEGASLQITNDLTVVTGGVVVATYATLTCGGSLTLTNGASLSVYGGETNGIYTNSYGALLVVSNTLTVSSNCWIYPFAHSTNGASVLLQVGGLAIRSGGGINADGRGYARTNGPGRGTNNNTRYQGSGGGGYGGQGGRGSTFTAGGNLYGSTNAPLAPGSGGGAKSDGNWSISNPSHGGGVVRVEAAGAVTIDGTITANGGNGAVDSIYNDTPSGGGSGGAIYITCVSFGGSSNGILQANGGNGDFGGSGYSGAGGGGRIAVWVDVSPGLRARYVSGEPLRSVLRTTTWPQFNGALSVTNGTGWENPPSTNAAYPGTVFFFESFKGTQFILY